MTIPIETGIHGVPMGKCERCGKYAMLYDKKVLVLEGGNEGEIISVKICRKCDLDIHKGRDDTFAYPDDEEASP